MKLFVLVLLLSPLAAQETTALSIRNVRFDEKKATVDFDVVNQSPKPVRSWLVTVTLGKGTSVLTPQNCQDQHCTADVDFGQGEATGQLKPEVQVSAVLFENATAEGDLKLLQSEIDDTRLRLRALEWWQAAFKTDASLAKAFEKTPTDAAYTSAVINEREIVELLASSMKPDQIATMLEQRVLAAREHSRLFPPRDPPYAPSETAASTRAITNKTRFAVVREEERDGQLRLVFRNEYDKEIVAFAFTQQQPAGKVTRSSGGHMIASGGLEEFRYGTVAEGDPIELACVIFRDGTADGDPVVVRKILDGWAGRNAEKARILPLVRAVANLPAPERRTATDRLIAELRAHPQEQPDAKHSMDFVLGEQAARRTVMQELQDFSVDETLKDLQQ
jgi:hypothetical protein